jgi:GNAT superfamily N-acetyltransferase
MSALDLTRVTDEQGLRDYHRVLTKVFDADFEDLPADPIECIRPGLSGRLNGEEMEFWSGRAEGVPAASLTLRYSERDNLDLVNITVDVHPSMRRRGFARVAAEAGLERVRELGRSRVLGEVPTRTRHLDPAPAEHLARTMGARPLLLERRRVLDIAALEPARLAALAADAARHAAGYSTVTWRDHTPAEYVDDMAGLAALMSTDPPLGEIDMDAEVWDAERFLERERSVVEQGRDHVYAAAREDRSGRLVGYTDIAVSAGSPIGFQWATIVHREHRGHRLGMLLKVANLEYLRREIPRARRLNTWNADENSYMVAVNDTLGFRPMEAWQEWGLSLAALGSG